MTNTPDGYSYMGEVNNSLMEPQQNKKNTPSRHPLVKCVMVLVVRGLFTSLKFPYVHFPTTSTTGADNPAESH